MLWWNMAKSNQCVCLSNEADGLLYCPDCGLPISKNALVCPYCARPLNGNTCDASLFHSECEKEWKLAYLSLGELGLLQQLVRFRHPDF